MKFLDLGKWFLPHDHDDIKHVVVWRNKAAYTLAILLTAFMALPVVTEFRYVDEAAAEEAHRQIENRLAGVETQLSKLSEQAEQEAIRDIRLQIYSLRERACNAPAGSELRSMLNSQVQDLRADYQQSTDDEFPAISCAELTGIAGE